MWTTEGVVNVVITVRLTAMTHQSSCPTGLADALARRQYSLCGMQ
jgi:hypothetical protein